MQFVHSPRLPFNAPFSLALSCEWQAPISFATTPQRSTAALRPQARQQFSTLAVMSCEASSGNATPCNQHVNA